MFTFRNLTIACFILLFSFNVVHFVGCRMEWIGGHFCSHTYIYMLVLLGLYMGISVTMAFFAASGFHHPTISKSKTEEKICALTFDDGPNPDYTPQLLDILRRAQVTATFFVIGSRLQGNEALIRTMDAEGHLVGNHSWSHSVWFDFFPAKRMRDELVRTEKAISGILGKSPRLFRPPFGVINPMLSKGLSNLNYQVIGWNVRSLDTIHRKEGQSVARILNRVSPGSVILLHDHVKGAPQLLEELLVGLKQKGYSVVPLSMLTQIKAYA